MIENTGGVMRDFVVVFHGGICSEHSQMKRRNCLMTEAANSFSAAAGPEQPTTRSPIAKQSSDEATARLSSGLHAVAPRYLRMEYAGEAMTVLHHAMYRDESDQTPV